MNFSEFGTPRAETVSVTPVLLFSCARRPSLTMRCREPIVNIIKVAFDAGQVTPVPFSVTDYVQKRVERGGRIHRERRRSHQDDNREEQLIQERRAEQEFRARTPVVEPARGRNSGVLAASESRSSSSYRGIGRTSIAYLVLNWHTVITSPAFFFCMKPIIAPER